MVAWLLTYIRHISCWRSDIFVKSSVGINIIDNFGKYNIVIILEMLFTSTPLKCMNVPLHYGDVIMGVIASQITSLMSVYPTVYSDADQRKHQSSASLAFVRGIHRGPVNSPHKWPVTRKMFPFDDVIMQMYMLMLHGCCLDYVSSDFHMNDNINVSGI